MVAPQILVVGLGNLPLPLTRHSVGHLIVDSLASYFGIRMVADSGKGGFSGHGNVNIGQGLVSLTLFKTKSPMNISGASVAAALRKTVRLPSSMIVVQDSLSHKVETLSSKFGGSANGHNGIKIIISALGGEMGFHRFRIGIGRDETDAATYVLNKLSSHERQFWGEGGEGIDVVVREIGSVVRNTPR